MIRRSITWPLAALISLFLAFIAVNSACTKNQRLSTIRATLVSVNTTRDEFSAWDLDHQREIYKAVLAAGGTKDDALAKIAAYEDKRRKVVDSFELTYKALALAATQTDGASFTAAIDAAKELIDSVNKLRSGGP